MGSMRAARVGWVVLIGMLAFSRMVDAASLTVAWDPSIDPDVVGYRVSMGTRSGVYSTSIDTGSQTFAQFANLTGGVTYYFVVQSYDAALDMSPASAEVAGIAPTSSPLAITCPAPTATSTSGSPIAVSFAVTTGGGVAPISTSCSPPSGSLFPVGSTAVSCSARDSVGATASCTTTVVVTSSATSNPTPSPTPAPAPSTAVDTTGGISTLAGRCPNVMFTVNGKTIITTSGTTYSRGSCSSLANGKQVQVRGTTQANGMVAAQSISVVH
jgi:hypothetical protein